MHDEYTKILNLVKKGVIDPLAARVKNIEDVRLKKLEELLKGTLEIPALKEAVKRQDSHIERMKKDEAMRVPFERAQLTKAYTELVHLEVAKMDKKLAQTELLEARLKGMETMIRSMEQTIDMLQRKR
jgi:hypothetical protein